MNLGSSIQFKALILLLVFSLNTVMGFACAIGIDMGFNSKHHDEEKQHQHSNNVTEHHHADGTVHHHEVASSNHHEISTTQSEEKNNCCNDNVIKFEQLDKNLANAIKANFSNPALVAIIHVFYLNNLPSVEKTINGKSVDRRCFPTHPDIRVSIQSFQI